MFTLFTFVLVSVVGMESPWERAFDGPEFGPAVYYDMTADFRVLEIDYAARRARTVMTLERDALEPDAAAYGHIGHGGLPSLFFTDGSKQWFDAVLVVDSATGAIRPAGIELNLAGDAKFVPIGNNAFIYSHLPTPPLPESETGLYFHDNGETVSLPERLKILHRAHVYGSNPTRVYFIGGHPEVTIQRVRLIGRELTLEDVSLPDASVLGNRSGTRFVVGAAGIGLFCVYNVDRSDPKFLLFDMERESLLAVSQAIPTRYTRQGLARTPDGDFILSVVGLTPADGRDREVGWYEEYRIRDGEQPWPELGRVEYDPETRLALVDEDGRMKAIERCRFDVVLMDDLAAIRRRTSIETWEERARLIDVFDDALHGRDVSEEDRWQLHEFNRHDFPVCELQLVEEQ